VEQVNARCDLLRVARWNEREFAASIAAALVTTRRIGVTVQVGAIGETENVSQTFDENGVQPSKPKPSIR